MPDQLTNRARKAAEEVRNFLISDAGPAHGDFISGVAAIFVRHMRKHMDILNHEDRIEAAKEILKKDVRKAASRAVSLEQALTDAYAKLDEAKSILGKVL